MRGDGSGPLLARLRGRALLVRAGLGTPVLQLVQSSSPSK
jgi:hypothetical protein